MTECLKVLGGLCVERNPDVEKTIKKLLLDIQKLNDPMIIGIFDQDGKLVGASMAHNPKNGFTT